MDVIGDTLDISDEVHLPQRKGVKFKEDEQEEKHLPGKHNQQDHAGSRGRSNGAADSASSQPKQQENMGLRSKKVGSGGNALDRVPHYTREQVGTTKVKLKNGKTRLVPKYDFIDSTTGKRATGAEAKRLSEIKVPPGVTDVRINRDAKADIQAMWKDVKGRSQSLYSKEHSQQAAAAKFEKLRSLNKNKKRIDGAIEEALDSKDEQTREAAAALYVINTTGFRIGGDRETGAEKQAYGATTLQTRHVKVNGDKVTFNFVGKKGVQITKTVKDAKLADLVERHKRGKSSKDKLFNTGAGTVRSLFKSIAGKDFDPKDLRTWTGTAAALDKIRQVKTRFATEAKFNAWQKTVAVHVAKTLGNTPSVALSSYIDPHVWDAVRQPSWGTWTPPKFRSK